MSYSPRAYWWDLMVRVPTIVFCLRCLPSLSFCLSISFWLSISSSFSCLACLLLSYYLSVLFFLPCLPLSSLSISFCPSLTSLSPSLFLCSLFFLCACQGTPTGPRPQGWEPLLSIIHSFSISFLFPLPFPLLWSPCPSLFPPLLFFSPL